jgi:hypothetical protein
LIWGGLNFIFLNSALGTKLFHTFFLPNRKTSRLLLFLKEFTICLKTWLQNGLREV